MSERERRDLAAWAEHDPPDGFADAVVAAWGLERREAEAELEASPTRTTDPGRHRTVGIVAGLAAAAAVLLLARAVPGETHTGSGAGEEQCDRGGSSSPSPLAGLADGPDEIATSSEALAADALAVLTHHCMPCHDGESRDAKAGALQVYDLRQARWWETMSDEQLREAQTRIEQLGAASDRQRHSMAAFVDAQLRQRAAAGSPS
ncbi:MAG: hypothetical protein H6712_03780 [Myxococcales bacterium]|nr:hypothetical protein [Myxococcales bacterium]MCB9712946.1 hypothetical protein [Myxococcales bacterium]